MDEKIRFKCLYCILLVLNEAGCQSRHSGNLHVTAKLILTLPHIQVFYENVIFKLKIMKITLKSQLNQAVVPKCILMHTDIAFSVVTASGDEYLKIRLPL